ncbi:hypothetical protein K652_15507 [Pseudomonas aeruginosa VRFPA02]|nr:hypothetical protein K652_15507 [Pseudomonas aeruginosa VRFPA02]
MVDVVRQALAIDECRCFFRQNLWFGEKDRKSDVLQVWFPGMHSDVGGGYAPKDSRLALVAFTWMLGEALEAGLHVDPARSRDQLRARSAGRARGRWNRSGRKPGSSCTVRCSGGWTNAPTTGRATCQRWNAATSSTIRRCSTATASGWPRSRSEPHADTGDEARLVVVLALGAGQVGAVAVGAVPGHPDVGRELATDLVAQAQAQLAIGKARTDAAGGIVPAVQVDLGAGLEDQPVGQQDVVLALQAQRALAVLAEEGGDFRLEVVERQALHAERRPGLRRAGLEILAHAGDQVPPGTDGVPEQRLDLGVLGLAVEPFAFAAQPQAVDVAADPAAGVPGQRAAVVGVLVFQLVEQEEAVQRAVVHLVPLQRRKGGTAVGLGRTGIGVRLWLGAACAGGCRAARLIPGIRPWSIPWCSMGCAGAGDAAPWSIPGIRPCPIPWWSMGFAGAEVLWPWSMPGIAPWSMAEWSMPLSCAASTGFGRPSSRPRARAPPARRAGFG